MIGHTGQPMGLREWLLLVTLASCFCGAFLFNQIALDDLPPLTITLTRVFLGAGALYALLRLRGADLPRGWHHWRAFMIMGGLANAVPFTLTILGQTQISSGLAAILITTTPLFTILVAHLVTRAELLCPNRLAGMLTGLAGAALVIGPGALLNLDAGLGELAGQLAALSASLAYAVAGIYGWRFRTLPPLTAATGQLTGATLCLLPLVLVVDRPWTHDVPGPEALGAIAALALLCSAIAYVLLFKVMATIGPTNLSLVSYIIPIGAVILGMVFLDERLELRQIFGMAVIFLGLATVDGRLPALAIRLLGRRPAPNLPGSPDRLSGTLSHFSRASERL